MDRGRGDESVDGSGLESGAGQVADAGGEFCEGPVLVINK